MPYRSLKIMCCLFQPQLMANLYMFLSLLTTGMHEACPGSKVIWYDSVTVTGELKWQNQLNEQNKYVRYTVCLYMYMYLSAQ